jgi:response regulator RpfG family c-di-GMP phosphodiesterase
MKILIVDDEVEIIDILSTLIESEITCDILRAESGQQAVSLLQANKDIDLILSDYNMPDGNGALVFDHNRNNGNIPFIFVSGGYLEDYEDVHNFYETNERNAYIHKPIDFEELITLVNKAIVPGDDVKNSADYCHVHLNLLYKFDCTKQEIFLKLNEQKYIKLKNSDDPSMEEIEKYSSKGNEEFYMKRSEFFAYMDDVLTNHNRKLLTTPATISNIDICGDSLEIMQDSLIQLGLTPDQLLLINTTIETCIDILESEKSLKEHLQVFLKGRGYFISHSLTAGHICYLLANKLGMGQDSIVNKLLYASVLHDVLLQDSDLCKIYDLESEDFKSLTSANKKLVKSHAAECAKLLETSDKIPGDVLTIIREHHELPNGEGFPRGIGESSIFGLSLIFIASLHIADHLFHYGHSEDSLNALLDKLNSLGFSQGHSEKIYKEFEEIVKKAKL